MSPQLLNASALGFCLFVWLVGFCFEFEFLLVANAQRDRLGCAANSAHRLRASFVRREIALAHEKSESTAEVHHIPAFLNACSDICV